MGKRADGKPITPIKGSWTEQVNQPGFTPKKKDYKLRYRIKGKLWELL